MIIARHRVHSVAHPVQGRKRNPMLPPGGDSNLPAADLVARQGSRRTRDWSGGVRPSGFRAVASAKLAIDQLIAPLCVRPGTRPGIGPLMLEVQKKLHVFRTGRGPLLLVSRPVDIALWDIAGKAAKTTAGASFWGTGATDIVLLCEHGPLFRPLPCSSQCAASGSTPASAHSSFMKLNFRRSAAASRGSGA